MLTLFLTWIGKAIFFISKTFNFGSGGTWPGEIALKLDPKILGKLAPENIILVAGTNGKTTTTLLLKTILEKNGQKVVYNSSGANLLNGIVSALITSPKSSLPAGRQDWAVLECDENTLPQIIGQIGKIRQIRIIVILLNLFRDQLDRYGEVDAIAEKWEKALRKIGDDKGEVTTIINADDPQLAEIGENLKSKVKYFGLENKNLYLSKTQHATDSTYCPKCGAKLIYEGIYFSHLGVWECGKCGLKRPKIDWGNWGTCLPAGRKWGDWGELAGVYNRYNILAAVLASQEAGVGKEMIEKGIEGFKPAFGRQEEIEVKGKKVRIILSKNPAGFNESLRTIQEFSGEKNLLLILNDRIPDGRDISWIWDVDFETISQISQIGLIGVSGDRVYDLALRLKYAGLTIEQFNNITIEEDLKKIIEIELKKREADTLYILATYSGMLEARKILTGRKIL